MTLLKCCTQYVSKFGKLSSGHKTRKGQFSFPSQRRAMPQSVPTTRQLCLFHRLARLYSKSFRLGFSSTWTKNYQMYKLYFKEAEEPEIKLPVFIESWRKQGTFRRTFTSISLTTLKSCIVWITIICGKFLKRWEYQITLPVFWETCVQIKKQQLEPYMEQLTWFQIRKGVWQGYILSPCLFNLYAEYIKKNVRLHESQAGIKTAGRNTNNLTYAWDDTTLMAEMKRN